MGYYTHFLINKLTKLRQIYGFLDDLFCFYYRPLQPYLASNKVKYLLLLMTMTMTMTIKEVSPKQKNHQPYDISALYRNAWHIAE